MVWFMQAGGYPIWIVLALGLYALVQAARLWSAPDPRRLAAVDRIARATLYATGAAVASDLTAVFVRVPSRPEWAHSPELPLIVMQGLGETLTPAILGFTLLMLTWLLTALAVQRLPPPLLDVPPRSEAVK